MTYSNLKLELGKTDIANQTSMYLTTYTLKRKKSKEKMLRNLNFNE